MFSVHKVAASVQETFGDFIESELCSNKTLAAKQLWCVPHVLLLYLGTNLKKNKAKIQRLVYF